MIMFKILNHYVLPILRIYSAEFGYSNVIVEVYSKSITLRGRRIGYVNSIKPLKVLPINCIDIEQLILLMENSLTEIIYFKKPTYHVWDHTGKIMYNLLN